MSTSIGLTDAEKARSDAPSFLTEVAFWLYVAVLAWAPFPLGSNRPWAWYLLILLIATCWVLWGLGTWSTAEQNWSPARRHPIALTLGLLALCWGVVQTLPWIPTGWSHPIWNMASGTLGQPLAATISINPWRTTTECLKITAYLMAMWLAYVMTRRTGRAARMLDVVIAIGAFYGLYAVVLRIAGFVQFEMFYTTKAVADPYLSGPFVLHNSYATFAGLSALAAIVRLITFGSAYIVTGRGFRQWLLSSMHFLFVDGVGYLFAFLICFSTLIASASRAGFLATMCGIVVVALLASARYATKLWAAIMASSLLVLAVGVIALSDDTLAARLNALVDTGNADEARLTLWSAALRMIGDAPVLGLGLGTFQDAYPLYASRVIPYIMDKAHNDYLEFAAGLGLPAAAAWWVAWLLLVFTCLHGVFARRRNRHFAILAVAASILVAVHSAFDFSLQIPAVTLVYVTFLGLGLAQSQSSRA